MLKKGLVSLVLLLLMAGSVRAQVPSPELISADSEATESATTSGIVEKVVEKKSDLTEPEGEVKSKLEKILEDNPVEDLRWNNFLRYTVFQAVKNGVPANTIVLVLLFPLVASFVVASRHLIGLRGLGIFTPSLLAIAFLATGMAVGVILFVTILVLATIARVFLRKLKLQYLPRMSLLLWVVSLGVFGALYAAGRADFTGFVTVGIFPILILMLLAEAFIDVQVGRSVREAMSLITSTFILAIVTSFVIGLETVQRAALLYPELIFFGVAAFDVFMGKYTGLRLLEFAKFKSLVNAKEDEE